MIESIIEKIIFTSIVYGFLAILNHFIKSPRLSKWLGFKAYLGLLAVIIAGVFLGHFSAKKAIEGQRIEYWSKENQENNKKQLLKSLDTLIANGEQKKEIASCMLSKYMLLRPEGDNGLSPIKLIDTINLITRECLKTIPNLQAFQKWNSKSEQEVVAVFKSKGYLITNSDDSLQQLSRNVLKELKIKFPNGIISNTPNDTLVYQDISRRCIKNLFKDRSAKILSNVFL